MKLQAVSPTAECSHHAPIHPFVPPSSRSTKYNLSFVVLPYPFVSKTPLKSQSLNKISRLNTIRRSCSSNSDGFYRDEPWFSVEGLAKSRGGSDSEDREDEGHRNKKLHCAISRNDDPFVDKQGRFDFLEPMMLGIRPEFRDWADQETVMWATIEQKAKSLDIPLSLRMIKKKLQLDEGLLVDSKDLAYCSVKAAFASMVFIVIELQSCALQLREALCHEDLEVITSKVQKDIHSSFVWLFQQVFSRTPSLMLHVMVLLANFSVHSTSQNIAIGEASFPVEKRQIQLYPHINSSLSLSPFLTESEQLPQISEHSSTYLGDQIEIDMWKSMVDDCIEENTVDDESRRYFVSPISVEVEGDGYEEYLRTDLLYQMNLSLEPTNQLLLCNYAQFLHLVMRDYDRAEECFKRAVQVLPPDAESLTQYANFLWTVRNEYLEAEENFLRALAMEPENSFYASRYANFLWSTGGEETCFPLNNPQNHDL